MKYYIIFISIFIFSCFESIKKTSSENNRDMAQSFLENIISNPEKA